MLRFPPKKILVAFDLSGASRTAWRHAVALAEACGAALEAVYVEPWQMGVDLLPPPPQTAASQKRLRAKVLSALGADAKIAILHGDPAPRILSMARRRHADMIVVGTHGRKGFERVLLGSTAEAVIQGSPVPVLAARGRARAVRSILAPVNFTPHSEYGFTYAAAAAAVLEARVTALHVSDDPIWSGNVKVRFSRLLRRLPAKIHKHCRLATRASVGEVAKGILRAGRGQDWIVLVAHKKSPILDAVFGTTLEQVLRRARIPVLSVPSPVESIFAARSGHEHEQVVALR